MEPITLLIILVALQLADWTTTAAVISRGGTELNPIIAKLISMLGLHPALAIKSVFAVWLAHFLLPHPTILLVLVLVYSGVVLWNLYQLYKQGRK